MILLRRVETWVVAFFFPLGCLMCGTNNEVDLSQLRFHLLNVVQETMQPEYLSLWLRPTSNERKPHTNQYWCMSILMATWMYKNGYKNIITILQALRACPR